MKKAISLFIFLTAVISTCLGDDLYQFMYKGKYGYVDESYRVIIEPQYDSASDFENNIAVVEKDTVYQVIDSSGKVLKMFPYDYVSEFIEGFAAFKENNTFGMMNLDGKIIIKGLINYARFSEGLASVHLDLRKWYYIDTNGKIVFPTFFSLAHAFSDGLAAVQDSNSNKWGFIDKSGTYVISPQYDEVAPGGFQYSHCIVIKDEKCFLINKKNDIVLKIKQTNSYIIGPHLFVSGGNYILAGNYKLMTFHGRVVKENFANVIVKFHDGFAFFESSKNRKCGIIDTDGKLLSPPVFSEVSFFHHGRAFIIKNGQGGIIDTSGKITWVKDFLK
ncbi:MAG: WG repeat-containing protein [Spirochaetales bacterium]|nr:WG repeat-containing protein [Spirochaetales bacterium]